MNPGEKLYQLRLRLGITTREVEEYSRRIAEGEGRDDFYISNTRLTQLENENSNPSIYKLYSLSVIYRVKLTELFASFGIDMAKTAHYQTMFPMQKTHLASMEPANDQRVAFPIRFDPGLNPLKTSLVSRMVELWGEMPISLMGSLNLAHNQFGYIGLNDFSLYPLLRPGSFVQIDGRLREVLLSGWRNEVERPIYFVELRDGYSCSWCEITRGQLILIPHPLSGCGIRQFDYPKEAEILGRVVGVAMRLVNDSEPPLETPRLPRRF